MSGWIEAALLGGLLALAGCGSDSHQADLDDYLTRIARVTEGRAELPEAIPLPGYPPRRALVLKIPRRTIGVVQFIEVHGCDMGALVGFRNSPLGRVQAASQRLGYETALLSAAERCVPEGEDWLAELAADKRAALPALFWNATFAAREMRIALGSAAEPAGGDFADILRGLNDTFTRVQSGAFDSGRFEGLLARLRAGSWAGPARDDWARWRRYLDASSTLLRQSMPGICLNRQPTPAVRRLENVFRKLYVERIQPELAGRMAEQQAWVTELGRLAERVSAVQPPAFRGWHRAVLSPDHGASEWRRTRQAVAEHVEAWQAVFAHCGIEPVSRLGQD